MQVHLVKTDNDTSSTYLGKQTIHNSCVDRDLLLKYAQFSPLGVSVLCSNKALKPTLRIGFHDCPLFNRSLPPSLNELINSG